MDKPFDITQKPLSVPELNHCESVPPKLTAPQAKNSEIRTILCTCSGHQNLKSTRAPCQ